MSTKVIFNFSRLRDDALSTYAETIITQMTGNVNFPNPVPSLADLTAAKDAYREALALVPGGGRDKTSAKNDRRVELQEMLTELALHVRLVSKRDRSMLLTSGFDVRKPPVLAGELATPVFKLVNGANSGSMKVIVEKVHGAHSYTYEYTTAPVSENASWKQCSVKSRTCMFEGLTSGQQYAFRVAGVGYSPTPVYSEVISRYIQ